MPALNLLTRDEFRKAVLDRDRHRCVFCGEEPHVHHIMERRLFSDGGYYLGNGAAVCEKHHKLCEATLISTQEVRDAAGISEVVLPPHLYSDDLYDKWGNIITNEGVGRRLKGELWDDAGVQKALGLRWRHVAGEFADVIKYPRTYHLPWSPGMTKDDRMMTSVERFQGRQVVVTEKMDGENTTMYRERIHARSLDSRNHFTRNWVKNLWGRIRYNIPAGWRICGENLYGKHSIPYTDLPSYFLGFNIWDVNLCLSWEETEEWFELLEIPTVPVLYRGEYNEEQVRKVMRDPEKMEGYVVRLEDEFHMSAFRSCVGKYVRAGHVTTVQHWREGQAIAPNVLA